MVGGAGEHSGGKETVPVRWEWEKIRGRVWRDCYCVLRPLSPWCGGGYSEPNHKVAAFHRSIP